MKKIMKIYLPILIMPILYFPFLLFNRSVLLDWFGCGCPQISSDGTEMVNYFSANDFTVWFWIIIALAVTVLSYFFSNNVKTWYYRWLHILVVAALTLFLAFLFIQSMMWK